MICTSPTGRARPRTLRIAASLAGILLLGPACSRGGGGAPPLAGGNGGEPPTAAMVNILMGDAASNDLSALEIWFTQIQIQRRDGLQSSNLVATPRGVNVLDPLARGDLIAVAGVEPGDYDTVDLAIDTSAVAARDLSGQAVAIRVEQNTSRVTFDPVVQAARGAAANAWLHIDLSRALSADPNLPGGWVLRLDGSVSQGSTGNSGGGQTIDEVRGVVTAVDPAASALTVDVTDPNGTRTGGLLSIVAEATASFVDERGAPLDRVAFFAITTAGARVQASGTVGASGIFGATAVRLEQRAMTGGGGGTGRERLRVAGSIVSVDPANARARLRLTSTLEGAATIEPVLQALGGRVDLDIDLVPAAILLPAGGGLGTPSSLRTGQLVRVRFSEFTSEPFPALEVEIQQSTAGEFDGVIGDVATLPQHFLKRLEAGDPAVTSGAVASARTDVQVVLDGTERLWIDLRHAPTIAAADLVDGLRVRTRGVLSGSPTTPRIDAEDVRVRPGRLDGTVTATAPGAATFTVRWDRIRDPFGPTVVANPVQCSFAPNVLVEDDASSVTEFFALFAGLAPGETIEVRLHGIADRNGGIVAHRLEVDLDD